MSLFSPQRRRRIAALLAATLSGGVTFESCETRFKEAAVAGTTEYLYSIFNPTTIVELLFDLDEET